MTRVSLKSLTSRRLRTALTALAIVLGVAMVSGAYTLTDTMRGASDSLSKSSYSGTDAVVSAPTAFDVDSNDDTSGAKPSISAGAIERVRSVPGVRSATGSISDEARIVGRDGKILGTGPYFGSGIDPRAKDLDRVTPFKLTDGRFATGPGEVVIGTGTAEDEKLAVGDRVKIQTRGPARSFEISGIANFGEVESIGTATFALFDLEAAQKMFGKSGRYDEILVTAASGTSGKELRERLSAELGGSANVQTAAAHDRFTLDGLNQFISFIQTFLLVFGGVALVVGAFTIVNTLSITVAQRSRELALLSAFGASRRQVLRSVVLEATVMGALGSVAGLFAGLGLAKGLSSVFAAMGVDLPRTATVFSTRTIVVSLAAGMIVTLVASLSPALRATRVSPAEVMREGAKLPQSHVGRRSTLISAVAAVLGAAFLGLAAFASGMDTETRLLTVIPGALLTLMAVGLASPRMVPGLASVIGRPGSRFGGSAGSLARQNAMRNPSRTALTAAALMIGVALVAFVAVLGQGLRESTTGSLKEAVRGDYVVVSQDSYSPIDPAATRAAAAVPGVKTATGITQDQARAFGKKAAVDGVDPQAIASVFGWEWKDGSDAVLSKLESGGAVVTDQFAEENGLKTGESFAVTAPTGKRLRLEVAGISKPDRFNPLFLGDVTVSLDAFRSAFTAERDRYGFIDAGGADRSALERALRQFPDVELQSKAEFGTEQAAWVDEILGIFYVLLALAVLISLIGIVNTLALSVVERTRELGMLKAIGMTRRQVRRMVRHESIITALIGSTLGIAVGLVLAAIVTTALGSEGLRFAVPVGALVAFTAVAAIAGVLAAVLPARRAAKLDPLAALAYE